MQETNSSEKLPAVLKLMCHSVKRFLDGGPLHSGTHRAYSLLSELPGLWFSHSIWMLLHLIVDCKVNVNLVTQILKWTSSVYFHPWVLTAQTNPHFSYTGSWLWLPSSHWLTLTNGRFEHEVGGAYVPKMRHQGLFIWNSSHVLCFSPE